MAGITILASSWTSGFASESPRYYWAHITGPGQQYKHVSWQIKSLNFLTSLQSLNPRHFAWIERIPQRHQRRSAFQRWNGCHDNIQITPAQIIRWHTLRGVTARSAFPDQEICAPGAGYDSSRLEFIYLHQVFLAIGSCGIGGQFESNNVASRKWLWWFDESAILFTSTISGSHSFCPNAQSHHIILSCFFL